MNDEIPNTMSDHMLANALRFSSLHSSLIVNLFQGINKRNFFEVSFFIPNGMASMQEESVYIGLHAIMYLRIYVT